MGYFNTERGNYNKSQVSQESPSKRRQSERAQKLYSSSKAIEESPVEIIQAPAFNQNFKRPSVTPFSKFEEINEEETPQSSNSKSIYEQ